MWGDSAIENNSSLYAWNRVPRDLLFLAYDGADLKRLIGQLVIVVKVIKNN